MTAHRYAIYIAPAPETPLWRFGSQVLGHDAATGEELAGFELPGFTAETWRNATARPRLYGFHGTLKAPFRLAPGRTPEELVEKLRTLASSHASFDAGALDVTPLSEGSSAFVVLTLRRHCQQLTALEQAVVREIDPFRADPAEAEIASRQPDRLTLRQRDNLARWGYPFVGDDYLFHMTLSGQLEHLDRVADALARVYAEQTGVAHLMVDALVLFAQQQPGGQFRILQRLPLA
jgi:hypothetical protein